jgi:DNA-directed RNA polymerase subunit RPC12/RpoP
MTIPMCYKATTKEVPAGSVIIKCTKCGADFHVPENKLTELGASPDAVCEECAKADDKAAVLNAAAELSADKNAEAADAVKTALGN